MNPIIVEENKSYGYAFKNLNVEDKTFLKLIVTVFEKEPYPYVNSISAAMKDAIQNPKVTSNMQNKIKGAFVEVTGRTIIMYVPAFNSTEMVVSLIIEIKRFLSTLYYANDVDFADTLKKRSNL